MRCPRCNSELPDNVQVCHCGQNLELSVSSLDELWDESVPGSSHGEDPSQIQIPVHGQSQAEVFTSAPNTAEASALGHQAPPPANHPPPPPASQPPPPPANQPAAPSQGRQAFGQGVQANISTRIVDSDPEKERHTRIVDVSVPAVVRRAQDMQASSQPAVPRQASTPAATDEGMDAMGQRLRLFYTRMHRVDRLAFWTNLLTFLSAFLPWRYVLGEGLFSGIEGLGAVSAGGAALVFLCIYLRTARRRLSGLVLFLQLVAAAVVVAVPVYQFFYQPGLGFHVGLYATAVCGAITIVLTFARMAVRSY